MSDKKAHELMDSFDIEVPWEVYRFFGNKTLSIYGDQAAITDSGDYGTLEELRKAIMWYVEQFGLDLCPSRAIKTYGVSYRYPLEHYWQTSVFLSKESRDTLASNLAEDGYIVNSWEEVLDD